MILQLLDKVPVAEKQARAAGTSFHRSGCQKGVGAVTPVAATSKMNLSPSEVRP